MKRADFLKTILFAGTGLSVMKLNTLNKWFSSAENTGTMPVLFLGHGSPMNAIEENDFVRGFRKVGQTLEKPKAILCISAHWETRGTYVTAMESPRTIHDFGGFPQALFEVQYPAPGSPELARQVRQMVSSAEVQMDHQWGLDHGAWSVIKHLYPDADVPVIQMSLDRNKGPQYHYQLAQELSELRKKGVLIIGSGNMVHNLGLVAWDKLNEPEYGYDWAIEAHEKMMQYIMDGNHKALVDYEKQGRPFKLAIPTPEHYLPLLYTLGLKNEKEEVELFNDRPIGGSLTMTSVKIG